MRLSDVPERVVARFQQRVGGDPNSCWDWPMSIGSHGYGQIGYKNGDYRTMILTHRLAWVLWRGPIRDDLTVDHTCRNRRCCNPRHLRLLTNIENAKDNGFNRKTHCPAGHSYEGENLYVNPKGHRICRACGRARWHERAS